MQYTQIGSINHKVSRIAFGCAIQPMLAGEKVNELLDAMVDLGINTFDTAENYGLSEVSLGNWMRERKNRDDLVIISKGCHPYDGKDRVNPEELIKDIEQSFERLGTDYIDVYFMHRDDYKIDPGIMVEILNEYHKKGKIGEFGGSNWTVERIEQANKYAKEHGLKPFTVSSPNYGLADQIGDPFGGGAGCVSISGPKNEKAREWYQREQMPIFAYSSLARGFFSGKLKYADYRNANPDIAITEFANQNIANVDVANYNIANTDIAKRDFAKQNIANTRFAKRDIANTDIANSRIANLDFAKSALDEFAIKGYCYPDNFERLRRTEILAKEKNCSVPQLALAWTLHQPQNVVLLVSARDQKRMADNLKGFDIQLTREELDWMDLR